MDLLFKIWDKEPAVATMVANCMHAAKRKVVHLSCRTAAAIMCTTVTRLELHKRLSKIRHQDFERELAERFPLLKGVVLPQLPTQQPFPALLTTLSEHSPAALSKLTALTWEIVPAAREDWAARVACGDPVMGEDMGSSMVRLLERCQSLRQVALHFSGIIRLELRSASPQIPLADTHLLFAPPVSVDAILCSQPAQRALDQVAIFDPQHVSPDSLAAATRLGALKLRSRRDLNFDHTAALLTAATQLTRLVMFMRGRSSQQGLSSQQEDNLLLTLQRHPYMSHLELFRLHDVHAAALSALTQVTSLALQGDIQSAQHTATSESVCLQLPNVKNLSLKMRGCDSEGDEDEAAQKLVSTMITPKLERICIWWDGPMPIREMIAFCVCYPSARIDTEYAMMMHRCEQVVLADGAGLVEAARKAPQVLEGPAFVDSTTGDISAGDLVEAIQVAGGGLSRLSFRSCDGGGSLGTETTLQCIAAACPGMKSLSLDLGEGFTSQGVKALTALRSLERLSLLGCRGLDDDCIVSIAHHLPRLQQLALDGLQGVSEAALLHLCGCAPVEAEGKKRNLLLNHADQLTEGGRQELVTSGWRM